MPLDVTDQVLLQIVYGGQDLQARSTGERIGEHVVHEVKVERRLGAVRQSAILTRHAFRNGLFPVLGGTTVRLHDAVARESPHTRGAPHRPRRAGARVYLGVPQQQQRVGELARAEVAHKGRRHGAALILVDPIDSFFYTAFQKMKFTRRVVGTVLANELRRGPS